jgi:hypothetical protein
MLLWMKKGMILVLLGVVLAGCGDEEECDAVVDSTIVQVDGSDSVDIHTGTANSKMAQSFLPESAITLNSIEFSVKKVGDPGDLMFSLHRADGARPDEDEIDGGSPKTIVASDVESGFFGSVVVTFTSEPELDSNRTYYVVIDVTGNPDPDNYYVFAASSIGGAYGNGIVLVYNSTFDDEDDAWSVGPSKDLQFRIRRCQDVK